MKVAVIGGGLSGLVSLKNCVEEGLEATCFEITNKCGGLWADRDAKYKDQDGISEIYQCLITNTSKEVMTFSDLPMPASYPTYLSPNYVEDHIQSYINTFKLHPFIKLQHRVLNVTRTSDHSNTGRWTVKVLDERTDEESQEVFDAVMLCTGLYGYPSIPNIPGLSDFRGIVRHSKSYTDPSQFKGQSVLVVGNGPSGCDIAADICENTDKVVYLSKNRGSWFSRRNYQQPADFMLSLFFTTLLTWFPGLITFYIKRRLSKEFDYKKYNIEPKERNFLHQQITLCDGIHPLIESGRIKIVSGVDNFTSQGVKLKTGEYIPVDSVMFATGFEVKIPYLDPTVFNQRAWNLYKHVWPLDSESNTLAVVGYIKARGPPLPSTELQARWAIQVFKGEKSLPDRDTMIVSAVSIERLKKKISINHVPYCWELARIIDCVPSLGLWSLITKPVLWCKLVFGPCVPYMFRLVGPGKWDEACQALYTTWDRIKMGSQHHTDRHS